MTSPVDTSVKFFTSKMLGAPVLRGQAGSLIAILDACLINGWGIQTASSVVVAGGVCTMTFPLDHASPVDGVVLVAGASIAALNGEQKVTEVAPNVIKFATAAANGTATGTITAKMAPAGWAKPFSGTNLAAYKSLDVAANGQFLRVNDTGTTAARANIYETMTAISTGTGVVPTSTQLSGGMYWVKSAVAGALPIDWVLAADSRFFYLFPSTFQGNDASYTGYTAPSFLAFGDPVNLSRAADPFSTFVAGLTDAGGNYSTHYPLTIGNTSLRYMVRAITGIGSAVPAEVHSMSSVVARDSVFDRASGQISFADHVIKTDGVASWRAKLPGLGKGEAVGVDQALTHTQLFRAGLPERSYLAVLGGYNTSEVVNLHLVAIDVTGPWR